MPLIRPLPLPLMPERHRLPTLVTQNLSHLRKSHDFGQVPSSERPGLRSLCVLVPWQNGQLDLLAAENNRGLRAGPSRGLATP